MYVWSHIARVWINRVRSSILYVVSRTGKTNISLSAFSVQCTVLENRNMERTVFKFWGQHCPQTAVYARTTTEYGRTVHDV